MKKHYALLLALLSVIAIFVACTTTPNAPETGGNTIAATDPATASQTDGPTTDGSSDAPPAPDTDAPTDTDATTEPESETEAKPETMPDPDGVRLDHKNLQRFFNGGNLVTAERVEDPDMGYVLKLASTSAGNDPHIQFSFKNYSKAYGADTYMAENYRYVLLYVKAEGCSQSIFELLYATGSNTGITGQCVTQAMFDNSSSDWQYIVFDMSNAAAWNGAINLFRLDYQPNVMSAGETMYISAIWFAKDEEEMTAITRRGMKDPFVVETDPVAESKVEELLATPDKAPAVDNTKLNAEKEDAGLDLWFNHAYTKTPAEDTKSTGWNSYMLRMAKNESEGVHLLLASKSGHNGISVSVTPFRNAAGNELKTELMYGYYFEENQALLDTIAKGLGRELTAEEKEAHWKVDGKTVADPLPWVKDNQTFDLAAGRSYMYVIKATTAVDSPAGEYTATVTIKDKNGNEIKTATVKAYVWNFTLPEETSCKTQMDLSWYNIYVAHECWEGDDSVLYKNYYDLLLSNRVCAYTLPYATQGTFSDARVNQYLDNPRVTAFNPIDWKNHSYNDDTIKSAYKYLSQKQEWLDKSYFYIVDEPGNKEALDRINAVGAQLKEHFPGYKMMAPMHVNYALNTECTEDFISYIQDAINVWCYKPYFYTTFAEYNYDKSLAYRMSAGIEKNLGTFADRMEKEQAEGDELWWYVTRRPESPEITLLIDTESVRHRILFWQQKLYNVDSFLYYLANDWYYIDVDNGVNAKHETASGADSFDCYGNGVLVYCGQDFGVYGGVGSLRLENVRDGIEDFEYLTMLEDTYGKEVTDALIHRLTTSISRYNTDIDNFTDLRVALGNILEEALAEKEQN